MDQRGHLFARMIYRRFTLPTKHVITAGSIAELLRKKRQHRLDNPLVHLCGGVIIHVNRQLHKTGPKPRAFPLIWSDLKITNPILSVNQLIGELAGSRNSK